MKLALIVIFLTLAIGCTKETEYNLLKGNLKGVVYGDGNNPFHVLLEGNNLSITTTTDDLGQYLFTGLTTGTYNLKFTREGFGTNYIYGFPFIGGDSVSETVPPVSMAQLPNASESNLVITMTVDTIQNQFYRYIDKIINWTADFHGSSAHFMAYLNSDANVSYKNYQKRYFVQEGYNILELTDYDTIFFKKNTTLYMVMYPYETTGSKYPDMNTGCIVYSGVQEKGVSNVASLIVK